MFELDTSNDGDIDANELTDIKTYPQIRDIFAQFDTTPKDDHLSVLEYINYKYVEDIANSSEIMARDNNQHIATKGGKCQ